MMTRRLQMFSVGALVIGLAVAAVLLSGAIPLDFAASENHGTGEIDVRIQARQTQSGRVEVRAQSSVADSEWTTHTPKARLLPSDAEPGRWYSSSSFAVSVADPVPDVTDPAGYTKWFVEQAIARYERDGREAMLAYYNSLQSIDGQWYMFIMDEDDVVVAHRNQDLIGVPGVDVNGPDGYPAGRMVIEVASVEGSWVDYQFHNPETGRGEIKHSWIVRQDGLIFGSGWYESAPSKTDDPGGYTKSFVARAIELYDVLGRDALIEYYNTAESVDGPWYVFVIGEDGRNVAHQVRDLIGLVAAEVDIDGYPAGAMVVAVASEEGAWVDYWYTNLETNRSETKHSWVVKHDGLIIGSGWYEEGPSKEHAPGAYTQSYVQRALELYRVLGRDATFEYYNSQESIDGEWYLFIHNVDGTRLVNGARADRPGWLGSNLHGTGVDVTGYDYTADTLSIETSGWISYVFPNPDAELQYQRKHSWIVRQGDLLFGSGWYDRNYNLAEQDPAGYARALVQDAIDRYDAEGREAVIEYHNSPESVDGEWYVSIYELDGTRLAHPYLPLGENVLDGGPDVTGRHFREEFIAIEDRGWVSYVFLNPDSGEQEQKHTWVVRHGDLFFAAGWYEAGAYEAPES
ncbi:MAG: hypothetical protein F4W96_06275 [Chloroflexi bacterium]|nr:hypothetical protein [Chloroflexota bacterium]